MEVDGKKGESGSSAAPRAEFLEGILDTTPNIEDCPGSQAPNNPAGGRH